MTQYLLRRAALFFLVLVGVNAASYILINYLDLRGPISFGYVPDDPVALSEVLDPYPDYLWGVLHGDLGTMRTAGARSDHAVLSPLARAFPKSMVLLGFSLTFSVVVGLLLGFGSVSYKKRRTSIGALMVSLAGFSMPGFYVGILAFFLMYTASLSRGPDAYVLPLSGYGLDLHLILPVLALSTRPTAEIARLTAEFLAEELPKDYVRAARAKGLPWRLVILRHAFRNVASAVLTAFGNSLAYLIGALVIIERVFQWGGIGDALLKTVLFNQFIGSNFNPAFTAGLATSLALIYVLADLLIEFATQAVDPRLRIAHGAH